MYTAACWFFFFFFPGEWLRGAILKRNETPPSRVHPWAATPWEKLADNKRRSGKERERERSWFMRIMEGLVELEKKPRSFHLQMVCFA